MEVVSLADAVLACGAAIFMHALIPGVLIVPHSCERTHHGGLRRVEASNGRRRWLELDQDRHHFTAGSSPRLGQALPRTPEREQAWAPSRLDRGRMRHHAGKTASCFWRASGHLRGTPRRRQHARKEKDRRSSCAKDPVVEMRPDRHEGGVVIASCR